MDRRLIRTLLILTGFMAGSEAARACHDGSPLILDLNGDGIHTTDVFAPVSFDIDGDGVAELVAWTDGSTEEGFLWLDLNRNGAVDGGQELFGDAMRLPWGDTAPNGFAALAVYDDPLFGGNADGFVSPDDLIWPSLRLWLDVNHDGVSQRQEIAPLARHGVGAMGLAYEESRVLDGNANSHRFRGKFLQRVVNPILGARWIQRPVHDVFFLIVHTD